MLLLPAATLWGPATALDTVAVPMTRAAAMAEIVNNFLTALRLPLIDRRLA